MFSNSPQFNKPDDAGSPLRLSESFFCWQQKLYGHSEKADISLEISNETFCLFFGMLLLRECHMLPHRKIYWETSPELL